MTILGTVRTGTVDLELDLTGLDALAEQFANLGTKFPKKYLTKAAKLAYQPILADAKGRAPKKKGTLRKGIKPKMETPNKRNKSVYRVWWDAKYADIFKGKKIKRQGLYGASPKRETGFYPISMEYGFKRKRGRREGEYFVRDSIMAHQNQSIQTIIQTLGEAIDQLTGG